MGHACLAKRFGSIRKAAASKGNGRFGMFDVQTLKCRGKKGEVFSASHLQFVDGDEKSAVAPLGLESVGKQGESCCKHPRIRQWLLR